MPPDGGRYMNDGQLRLPPHIYTYSGAISARALGLAESILRVQVVSLHVGQDRTPWTPYHHSFPRGRVPCTRLQFFVWSNDGDSM